MLPALPDTQAANGNRSSLQSKAGTEVTAQPAISKPLMLLNFLAGLPAASRRLYGAPRQPEQEFDSAMCWQMHASSAAFQFLISCLCSGWQAIHLVEMLVLCPSNRYIDSALAGRVGCIGPCQPHEMTSCLCKAPILCWWSCDCICNRVYFHSRIFAGGKRIFGGHRGVHGLHRRLCQAFPAGDGADSNAGHI